MAEPTPEKARQILHDREVRGHPLTDRQRRFMGAIASGRRKKNKRLKRRWRSRTE